jgi:hypothetical protein
LGDGIGPPGAVAAGEANGDSDAGVGGVGTIGGVEEAFGDAPTTPPGLAVPPGTAAVVALAAPSGRLAAPAGAAIGSVVSDAVEAGPTAGSVAVLAGAGTLAGCATGTISAAGAVAVPAGAAAGSRASEAVCTALGAAGGGVVGIVAGGGVVVAGAGCVDAAGGGVVAGAEAAGALAAATSGVAAAAGFAEVAGLVVDVGAVGVAVFRSDVHATTVRSSTSAISASVNGTRTVSDRFHIFRLIPAPCSVSGFGERTPHSSGRAAPRATTPFRVPFW